MQNGMVAKPRSIYVHIRYMESSVFDQSKVPIRSIQTPILINTHPHEPGRRLRHLSRLPHTSKPQCSSFSFVFCFLVCFARQTTPVANSLVEPAASMPADANAIPPSSMAVGAAPPSESQVAASAGDGGGGGGADALPVAAVPLGNGSGGKVAAAKVRKDGTFFFFFWLLFLALELHFLPIVDRRSYDIYRCRQHMAHYSCTGAVLTS